MVQLRESRAGPHLSGDPVRIWNLRVPRASRLKVAVPVRRPMGPSPDSALAGTRATDEFGPAMGSSSTVEAGATDGTRPSLATAPSSGSPAGPAMRNTGWGPLHVVPRKRPSTVYLLITSVVLVVIVVAALALTGVFHRGNASTSTLLVVMGTRDLIPASQFDSVVINAKTASEITGMVAVVFAVNVYTMNISQFNDLVKMGSVSGYETTSGMIENTTSHNINLVVRAGISYLVFLNSYPVEALVGFSTNLTLVEQ